MLDNMVIFLSNAMRNTTSSITAQGMYGLQGNKIGSSITIARSYVTTTPPVIMNGVYSTSSELSTTYIVLCSEPQLITRGMYCVTNPVTNLTLISNVVQPMGVNNYIYSYLHTVKNDTSDDIIIKSVALHIHQYLLDVININPIIIHPNETYTFNYKF